MAGFRVELGAEVKDKITGFRGIVAGRAEYLTGCRQYCLSPKAKGNEYKHSEWFDEDRLIEAVETERNPGGPQSSPAPSK